MRLFFGGQANENICNKLLIYQSTLCKIPEERRSDVKDVRYIRFGHNKRDTFDVFYIYTVIYNFALYVLNSMLTYAMLHLCKTLFRIFVIP